MRIRKGFDFTLTMQLGPRLMGHLSFSQASHQTNTCIPTLTEVLPFSVNTIIKFQVSCRKVLEYKQQMSLKIKVKFFDYQNAQKLFDIDSNSKIFYCSSFKSVKTCNNFFPRSNNEFRNQFYKFFNQSKPDLFNKPFVIGFSSKQYD